MYIKYIEELKESSPQEAKKQAKIAEVLAKKNNFKLYQIYDLLSDCYLLLTEYKKSSDYALLLLNECKQLKGNLKLDFEGQANEVLASINSSNGNHKLAIKYQTEAINSFKKIKGDNYYILSYINLANHYINANDYENAIYYYSFVEENLEKENLQEYYSYVYNGLALCYESEKKSKKAIEYYQKSIDAVKKYNPDDISSLATAYSNIGNTYQNVGDFNSAILNQSEALEIFKKLEDKKSEADVLFNLSIAYQKLNMLAESNEYMMQYVILQDTLVNQDTRQTIHDLSIKYESEKKEQQNKILEKDNEKKQLSIYFALAGLSLVFVILLIIFRNNRIKAKTNKKLEEQNTLIEAQKETLEEQHFLLEEKSKEITDSIKYAERIQGAILPPDQKWNYILPNSFVLNKPKDILSGDFYWIAETESHIFVAAADCTGHGVPGALISIVNFNLLNKAVLERSLETPSEILDAVNIWLTESLNQTDSESQIKDGMDISLISINKKNGQIIYSGANNPLYLFSGNELIETKADKFPVGAYINEEIRNFTNKEIVAKFGDTIYLFSDGFADQFGGEKGKKYKYSQFKEALFKAKDLPIEKQKEFLHKEYRNWRGKYEQTDDILVIGIKF
ncbi:MAG: tetratricopeptide repeat protein [Flavobacteriia bacterium]